LLNGQSSGELDRRPAMVQNEPQHPRRSVDMRSIKPSQNCLRSVVTASSGGLKNGACEALFLIRESAGYIPPAPVSWAGGNALARVLSATARQR
jgi:hypothetical protein